MRSILQATLAAAAACALSAGVLVTTGQPASAAGTCNRTTEVSASMPGVPNPFRVVMPSNGTTAASTSCTMGNGAQSSAVGALQRTLNECYQAGLGRPDNIFGTQTREALKRAQRRAGMTGAQVDGVYGPITRDKIEHFNGDGYPCIRYNGPGGA